MRKRANAREGNPLRSATSSVCSPWGSTSLLALASVGIASAIALAVILDFAKTRRGEVADQVDKANIAKAAEDKKEAARQRHIQSQREVLASQTKAAAERDAAQRDVQRERLAKNQEIGLWPKPGEVAVRAVDPNPDKPDADQLERRAFLHAEEAKLQATRKAQRELQAALEQAAEKKKAQQAIGAFGLLKPKVKPDVKRLYALFGKPPKPRHAFTQAEIEAAKTRGAEREFEDRQRRKLAAINSVSARQSIIQAGEARAKAEAEKFQRMYDEGVSRATP